MRDRGRCRARWWLCAVVVFVLPLRPAVAGVADTPLPRFTDGKQSLLVGVYTGVVKRGALQTSFECTSLAGAPIDIGVEVFDESGVRMNDVGAGSGAVLGVPPRATVTIGTSGTAGLLETVALPIAGVAQGSARVLATSTAVRCNVLVLDASVTPPAGVGELLPGTPLGAGPLLVSAPLPSFPDATPATHAALVPGAIKRSPLQTEIFCTSLAAQPVRIGVQFFGPDGTLANNVAAGNGALLGVAPGATVTFATGGTAGFLETQVVTVSSVAQGLARIVSDSAEVVCAAAVVDDLGAPPGALTRLPLFTDLASAPAPTPTWTPTWTPTPTLSFTPTPTPTPTRTPTGTPARRIVGAIRYFVADRPVPGVTLELTGTGTSSVVSDALGAYDSGPLASGTWLVTPARTGGFGSAISALDAAFILQAVVGRRTLDGHQQLACDVSGNGSISALDAARVLQFVVGRITRFPVAEACGSDWAFFPAASPAPGQSPVQPAVSSGSCTRGGIAFVPLAGEVTGQDFTAVLFGDCSGNWRAAGTVVAAGARAQAAAALPARVGLGRPRPERHGRWTIPVMISSRAPVTALELRLAFDARRGRPLRVEAVDSSRWLVAAKAFRSGTLRLALASAGGSVGGGEVVARVRWKARRGAGRGSLPRLVEARVNGRPARLAGYGTRGGIQ